MIFSGQTFPGFRSVGDFGAAPMRVEAAGEPSSGDVVQAKSAAPANNQGLLLTLGFSTIAIGLVLLLRS